MQDFETSDVSIIKELRVWKMYMSYSHILKLIKCREIRGAIVAHYKTSNIKCSNNNK